MGFHQVSDAILTQFNTNWTTLRPLVPVAWPNLPFDPATEFVPGVHQGWVGVQILPGDTNQVSIAGASVCMVRTVGLVVLDLHCESGEGSAVAEAIADDMRSSIQGTSLNAVRGVLRMTSLQVLGNEGPWYRILARTPFRYDEMIALGVIVDAGTIADWTLPRYYYNQARDAWVAYWLASVDGDTMWRYKTGATQLLATPDAEDDGNAVGRASASPAP